MRTIRTPENREAFLDALSTTANVTRSCEAAGIARRAVYDWRNEDEAFKADWEAALELGTDALEDEAVRRAHEGVDEPVFYQGEACGVVRKYSDTLMIFMLKARRPEKFAERSKVEMDGTHRVISSEPLNDEDWETRYGSGVEPAGGAAESPR